MKSIICLILISILFFSCNDKERLKEKLTSLYGLHAVIINDSLISNLVDNSLYLDKDNLCSVPRLYEDRYESLEKFNTKWDVEIKDGKNYLIIKGTRFKGKYLIEYDEISSTIILTSDKIILKGQKMFH